MLPLDFLDNFLITKININKVTNIINPIVTQTKIFHNNGLSVNPIKIIPATEKPKLRIIHK